MGDRSEIEIEIEDGGRDERQSVLRLKQLAEYSKFKLMMIGAMVALYYTVRQNLTNHASRPYFIICRSSMFVNFFADIVLTLLISHLQPFGRINGCLKTITYATNIVAMLTSVSLLLLRNTSYALFIILLLPVIAIVIIVFYKEIRIDQAHEITGDEDYESELKKFFNLPAVVTNTAFGGMIATIFGYFKKFPKNVDRVPFKFSEVLMFLTVNLGLLAMLLTTIPPSLHHPNARTRLVGFIKVLSYTSFGLLALTVLAVGGEVVGRLILLDFFPIFCAIAVWFSMEIMQDDRRSQSAGSATGYENEPGISSITITTSIFAVIMAVYAENFTSEDHGFNLRACMFLMSMAFMSSLGWILQAFKPPRTESLEMVMKVLICFTTGGLVLAMVYLI